jgi:hypothetical protein
LRRSGLFIFEEVNVYAIKSPRGKWSVSLCNCSRDTAHFHYGNVVLHISLDDLRELGMAMQSVAENVTQPEQESFSPSKKGWVQ